MKNKYKLLAYVSLPVIGIGLLGTAGLASAHGFGIFGTTSLTPDQVASHQQTMFQNSAELLGISVDEVKAGWAQGKSLMQLAQDHGITKEQLQQKMKDARLAQMKTQLQTLVDKGVISQAQADQRLQSLQTTTTKGRMGRGFHGAFGF